MVEVWVHGLLNNLTDIYGIFTCASALAREALDCHTYQPSRPDICKEKKTSAILLALTSSNFFCLCKDEAVAHSRVLRLLNLAKLGRGGVLVFPLLEELVVGDGGSPSPLLEAESSAFS